MKLELYQEGDFILNIRYGLLQNPALKKYKRLQEIIDFYY